MDLSPETLEMIGWLVGGLMLIWFTFPVAMAGVITVRLFQRLFRRWG